MPFAAVKTFICELAARQGLCLYQNVDMNPKNVNTERTYQRVAAVWNGEVNWQTVLLRSFFSVRS